MKKDFAEVSVVIYALYKMASDSLSTQLALLNHSQVSAMMVSSHEALLRNTSGYIRHPTLTIQTVGSRTFAPRNIPDAPAPPRKTSTQSSTITPAPAKKAAGLFQVGIEVVRGFSGVQRFGDNSPTMFPLKF